MPEGLGLLDSRSTREQALYQGLLGASAGILAGNAPSFHPGGVSRAIGQGLLGFQGGMAQAQDRAVRQGLLGARLAEAQRKAEQERRQQELVRQAAAGLPPQLAAIAQAAPSQFFGAMAQSAFPKPAAPPQPTELARLHTEMAALPQGDPRRKAYENAIALKTERAPPQDDRTLVQIPDPQSPTGFRYVPRAQAAGQPAPGGGITPTQERGNIEIDAARRYLDDRGLDFEEIKRRTQRQTDTGRDNPDYDPMLASIVRKATRKKIGDDPDFETIYGKLLTPAPAPAPAAPTPPQPSGSSWWQRNAPQSLGGRPTQVSPPVEGARKAPDGKWYVPDPNRPGKYLRVEP